MLLFCESENLLYTSSCALAAPFSCCCKRGVASVSELVVVIARMEEREEKAVHQALNSTPNASSQSSTWFDSTPCCQEASAERHDAVSRWSGLGHQGLKIGRIPHLRARLKWNTLSTTALKVPKTPLSLNNSTLYS